MSFFIKIFQKKTTFFEFFKDTLKILRQKRLHNEFTLLIFNL